MPTAGQLKPTDKAFATYYETLQAYVHQRVGHEGALRSAFQNLLSEASVWAGR